MARKCSVKITRICGVTARLCRVAGDITPRTRSLTNIWNIWSTVHCQTFLPIFATQSSCLDLLLWKLRDLYSSLKYLRSWHSFFLLSHQGHYMFSFLWITVLPQCCHSTLRSVVYDSPRLLSQPWKTPGCIRGLCCWFQQFNLHSSGHGYKASTLSLRSLLLGECDDAAWHNNWMCNRRPKG